MIVLKLWTTLQIIWGGKLEKSGYNRVVVRGLLTLSNLFWSRLRGVAREYSYRVWMILNFHWLKIVPKLCIWVAYLYNWTGIILSVYTIGMMVYLFYLVRCLAKGNTLSPPRFLQSKQYRIILEIVYVFLPSLLSFAYASVPYFNHNYGLASAWCWIRNTDENCKLTLSGLLDQLLNGYIFYETGGIAGVIFTIAIAIVYWRLPSTLYEARLLLKKTFFMLLCLLLSVLIVMIAFINGMHVARTGQYQHLAGWLTIASLYPISLLLFPFGFLICFYSGKMFNRSSVKHTISKWLCSCTKCKSKQKNAGYVSKHQLWSRPKHQRFLHRHECLSLAAHSSRCPTPMSLQSSVISLRLPYH